MKIRDSHATLAGDDTEHTMLSESLDIIAEDGKTLFTVRLQSDGSIRIRAGHFCRHGGKVLNDVILISPQACNAAIISRPTHG